MNKIFDFQSKLVSKTQLAETIFEYKYEVPAELIYTPGQFIGARVIPTHTRAYSIVDIKDGLVTIIIDLKPGGIASKYFEEVKVGDVTRLMGPYGIYKTKDTDLPKVFISTGSGIAPFVSMIHDTLKNKPQVKIHNFFGVKQNKDDIALPYFKDMLNENFMFVRCVTREEPVGEEKVEAVMGRVTGVVPEYNFDWQNTEFYICGSTAMIMDMVQVLKSKGADKIYFEKYG